MASLIQCHSLCISSSFSSPRIEPQTCPISVPLLSKIPRRSRSRRQRIVTRAKPGDGVDPAKLLEYDSVWETKPAWCQPWTIVLTGSGIVTGSWLALNSVEVTSVATTLILLWWLKFLYFYPKEFTSMIAELRKNVNTERQS